MKVALKEWSVVIEALARGRQIFLLRKGGLAESREGFRMQHDEFAFYPTWEHQQREQVRPEFQPLFDELEPRDPKRVRVSAVARVERVIDGPPNLAAWSGAEDFHIWTEDYLRMRYEYRPDLPLRLAVLRVDRLVAPVTIPYDRRYGGCRSWVELYNEIEVGERSPALSGRDFEHTLSALQGALGLPQV